MFKVENVENVLAIEILSACQALEFLRPLKSTKPIEAVYALIRSHVPALEEDRYMSPDMNKVADLIKSGEIWRVALAALNEPTDIE